MNSHDKDVIRQKFDDYLRMYAASDASLTEHFVMTLLVLPVLVIV